MDERLKAHCSTLCDILFKAPRELQTSRGTNAKLKLKGRSIAEPPHCLSEPFTLVLESGLSLQATYLGSQRCFLLVLSLSLRMGELYIWDTTSQDSANSVIKTFPKKEARKINSKPALFRFRIVQNLNNAVNKTVKSS